VLARYGLAFGWDVCGRPLAVGAPDIRVSVSHSGGVLLIGLAAGCHVGVDVEPLAERGLVWLPAHALTTAELGQLERTGGDRVATFLSYWTRKEALLKAAGVGLAVEPRLVELGPPGGSPRPAALPEALGPPSRWTIAELPLRGFRAAVAAEAQAIELRLFGIFRGQRSSPRAPASPPAWASAS
jgi:4'-phosphopantetheinyl transferase